MTSHRRHAPIERLGPRLGIGLAVIVAFVMAACSSAGSSASPSPSVQPAGTSAASPAGVTSSGSPTSQTDTAWGRIWDTLPSSFPKIPGSRPSEETATGPASATLVIDGNVARLVATAMVTDLKAAGFPTAGLGSPLEDGSYTLDATGPTAGCKVQVTVRPMGGMTAVIILYGASCPHA